jgi:hypothetical protein
MVPEIFVTAHDAARLLERFRDPFYAPLTNFLGDELRWATAVAPRAVPRDVVTMNARVRYREGKEPRPGLWCGLGSLLGRILGADAGWQRVDRECAKAKPTRGRGSIAAAGALPSSRFSTRPKPTAWRRRV